MKKIEVICERCDAPRFTFSRARFCKKCFLMNRAEQCEIDERALLESMDDYCEVEGPVYDKYGHRTWSFTHVGCGTQQTWVFGNLMKRLKLDPDSVPCSKCGSERRTAAATAASSEKYGIKDVHIWTRYRKKVRNLTEATYRQFIGQINPENLKRSTHDWHLDHRKAIVQCFLDGDPPEFAARRENLEMLTAYDNLSKGRS